MKAIVLELDVVGTAGDLVKSRLFPDTPTLDATLEKVILEELTLLLSIYLRVGLEQFDIDDEYDCDYYDECEGLFDEIHKKSIWNRFGHFNYRHLEVLDTSGLVALWFDPPHQEIRRHVTTQPAQHRIYRIV